MNKNPRSSCIAGFGWFIHLNADLRDTAVSERVSAACVNTLPHFYHLQFPFTVVDPSGYNP